MAALGIVLVVLGAWVVVKLGPSGEARFSATSKAPGAVVITPEVLNSVDSPVRVTATRGDGGSVRLTAAPSSDARAILGGSAVSTVGSLQYPLGTMKLRASGSAALPDISTADVWRLVAKGKGSAELVVDQAGSPGSNSGSGPETAVVTSGDSTPLTDVTVTLTWADRAWFFEALILAIVGAVMAAFAFNYLWQSRVLAVHPEAAGATSSEPTS